MAISRLKLPVWLIHGEQDGLIGVAHGVQLFAAAQAPKQLLRIPGGQHTDALMRPDFQPRFLALLGAACGTAGRLVPSPGPEPTH